MALDWHTNLEITEALRSDFPISDLTFINFVLNFKLSSGQEQSAYW